MHRIRWSDAVFAPGAGAFSGSYRLSARFATTPLCPCFCTNVMTCATGPLSTADRLTWLFCSSTFSRSDHRSDKGKSVSRSPLRKDVEGVVMDIKLGRPKILQQAKIRALLRVERDISPSMIVESGSVLSASAMYGNFRSSGLPRREQSAVSSDAFTASSFGFRDAQILHGFDEV